MGLIEKYVAKLQRLFEPRMPPAADSAEAPTADRPPPPIELAPLGSAPDREPARDVLADVSADDVSADSVPADHVAADHVAANDVSEVRALLEAVAEAPIAAPEPEAPPAFTVPEPTARPSIDQIPREQIASSPAASDEEAVDIPSVVPAGVGDALILTLETPAATFTIARSGATLGRGPENPIHLDDLSVSRRHARIAYKQGGYWLSDLGSMGGTWVDGTRLSAPRRIAAGEVIDIGHCRLTVSFAAQPAKAESKKTASGSRSELAGQARRRR